MKTEAQKQKDREAVARYRAANKEILKVRRKAAWAAAKTDPVKMAKIQAGKASYRKRNRSRLNEEQKQWAKENPDKVKTLSLAKYGITLAEYEAKLTAQNHLCAVCGKPEVIKERRLAVDHNHKTGQVRDLLCSLCNKGIGSLQEDPALLLKAIEYLEKWGIVVIPNEEEAHEGQGE